MGAANTIVGWVSYFLGRANRWKGRPVAVMRLGVGGSDSNPWTQLNSGLAI